VRGFAQGTVDQEVGTSFAQSVVGALAGDNSIVAGTAYQVLVASVAAENRIFARSAQ
jgi:hypothetical protein